MKIPQEKFQFAPAGLKKILGSEPWHITQDGTLVWQSGKVSEPSEADILSKIDDAEKEYKSLEYQRARRAEYPSIGEQLDLQYWDKVNGTSKWQESISKVKSDHPKPTE